MLNYTVPQKKTKFKSIMFKKQVKNPMLIGSIFFILIIFFFLLSHRTKEPVTLPSNHVVEHRIVRIVRTYLDDEDGMKV